MAVYNGQRTGTVYDTSITNVINAVNDGGIASKNWVNNNFPTKTGGGEWHLGN